MRPSPRSSPVTSPKREALVALISATIILGGLAFLSAFLGIWIPAGREQLFDTGWLFFMTGFATGVAACFTAIA